MNQRETQDEVLKREKAFHDDLYSSKSDSRAAAKKYSRLKAEFDKRYMKLVKERAEGSKVLEIGCGPNINTPHWVDIAAECHGIDISDVAISQARERLGKPYSNTHLSVMNAESMEYDDNYFDVVCGKGIIHHLNTESAFKEVSRVLKPGGLAVFIEPLGHNPFINLYRRLTPKMRSDDEHPLLMSDIEVSQRYFGNVNTDFQHITSILSAFIPGNRLHSLSFQLLNSFDSLIIKSLPFTKKYSWMALIRLQEPYSA
ncbi:class I SAM-dependent methyltransferase [Natronogracilivirga saccharolytica]|uniref:Class I SAM-dependent methyltransferase n=1 Tax=Natronogracilivirga saccharolytica TaxID=2812953 RepID=A0A8J7RPS5_9BACT|nr:class I SAM-dependent methyltransferase [Natronogracilivirga saccharolytica]MBP3193923.1 class I SAM-dependent methyltransferase [Natronogracilivirga saccharolytica]